MPHAVDEDEQVIQRLVAGENITELEGLLDGPLGATEEKADDAEDYGDISDDDLAEDEDDAPQNAPSQAANGQIKQEDHDDDLDGLFNADIGGNDDHIDLFGSDDLFTTPIVDAPTQDVVHPTTELSDVKQDRRGRPDSSGSSTAAATSFEQEAQAQRAPSVFADEDSDEDAETREQRLLFEQAFREREQRLRRGDNLGDPPPPPETDAELFSIIWPHFEKDKPPRFSELLPPKRAYWVPRAPLKPPRPVLPTKVNLEIHADQEKSFRLPGTQFAGLETRRADAESKGLVLVEEGQENQNSSDDEPELEDLGQVDDVGKVKWQDLVTLCTDWTVPDGETIHDEEMQDDNGDGADMLFDDMFDENPRPAKKPRFNDYGRGALQVLHNVHSFDDPEKTTAKLARRVHLDFNDPHLLLDQLDREATIAKKRTATGSFKRDAAGGLTKDFTRRYNISNDEAYDLLKENHQNKVRGTLGNVNIEHAGPAVRLQFPFYKVKLTPKEARSWHRHTMHFPHSTVFFDKREVIKKKNIKGKDVRTLYEKSEDLSLRDNASNLLLEYSEEYPSMLSGFGMGSRLINYYRRKDEQDTSRPKLDIGETIVLLPQDKSPYSIFGDVDRGQTMPTIHNGMYRAPVFKHENNPRDFVVIRSTTGVEGQKWYLRNTENLHVVGQELPLVEVPGTHSRKVTDAAKKRLRMVSWRIYKKNMRKKQHSALKNEMILDHLPGSDIAQNRSKMREFMDYDKDRGWVPKKGQPIPEEVDVQSWLKPEDICLLDSMQVGDRHLQDAGYNKAESDIEDEDEEESNSKSIDQQLAPWQTTKNFLNACQGKAMLKLWGEGDPTGRGEAFNMIRTSMKGGFREIGESVEDRLDAKRQKELGGHSYNVARQQKAYNDAIRRIWEAQRVSLSSNVEHDDDIEMSDAEEQGNEQNASRARTPSTSFAKARAADDSASAFSRATSQTSQTGRVLRITRTYRDKYGREEARQEIIRDPKVIREYIKRRRALDIDSKSIADLKYSGNEEEDRIAQSLIEKELARLETNKQRRQQREKAKANATATTPDGAGSGSQAGSPTPGEGEENVPVGRGRGKGKKKETGTTQRKCANCGQVGHIKTNKKYCTICEYFSMTVGESGFGQSSKVGKKVSFT